MELRYFPSDYVVNLQPHLGDNGFPVALNALGLVQMVDEQELSVTVLWSTGVTSTVKINTLVPRQRPSLDDKRPESKSTKEG